MNPMRRMHARRRQGNYSILLGLIIVVILGFGALAIDIAYMRYAQAQAQDVADAAAQAGVIVLRLTGDEAQAHAAAQAVISANNVVGQSPDTVSIRFGNWDAETTDYDPSCDDDCVGSTDRSCDDDCFIYPAQAAPNACEAKVTRSGGSAIDYLLARVFGKTSFDVTGKGTAATRSFQILLVLDITGSWHEDKFADAREAVLLALDMLAESSSGVDEVGMTIFTNRYAWEYTPFTQLAIPGNPDAIRADWEVLNIASKAGVDADHYDGADCQVYPHASHPGKNLNDFSDPPGGCYPDMPREYKDESGTDHSTGMYQAEDMFQNSMGGPVYRAMIVITDGKPNGLGASSGEQREADGYVEDRWTEFKGAAPRTTAEVRTESIKVAQDLNASLQVNTWMVSLVAYDSTMMPGSEGVPAGNGAPGVPQGDGYWRIADNSAELSNILAQIISEMPLALVD